MPSREVGGGLGMELCLGPLLIGQALPNCPFIKVSDSTRVRASFLHHSFLLPPPPFFPANESIFRRLFPYRAWLGLLFCFQI